MYTNILLLHIVVNKQYIRLGLKQVRSVYNGQYLLSSITKIEGRMNCANPWHLFSCSASDYPQNYLLVRLILLICVGCSRHWPIDARNWILIWAYFIPVYELSFSGLGDKWFRRREKTDISTFKSLFKIRSSNIRSPQVLRWGVII